MILLKIVIIYYKKQKEIKMTEYSMMIFMKNILIKNIK